MNGPIFLKHIYIYIYCKGYFYVIYMHNIYLCNYLCRKNNGFYILFDET